MPPLLSFVHPSPLLLPWRLAAPRRLAAPLFLSRRNPPQRYSFSTHPPPSDGVVSVPSLDGRYAHQYKVANWVIHYKYMPISDAPPTDTSLEAWPTDTAGVLARLHEVPARLEGGKSFPDLATLLKLGSIWMSTAPETSVGKNKYADPTTVAAFPPPPFNPVSSPKLISSNITLARLTDVHPLPTLHPGSSLRLHFNPRRYPLPPPSWLTPVPPLSPLYAVVHKPPNLPSHATVDNIVENAASLYAASLSGSVPPKVYVQSRLDTDTSGLLPLTAERNFASYYGKLLEGKTSGEVNLPSHKSRRRRAEDERFASAIADGNAGQPAIRKKYRCLCALVASDSQVPNPYLPSQSVSPLNASAVLSELSALVSSSTVVTHHVLKSLRSPKTFVADPPRGADASDYLLCKLQLTSFRPAAVTFASAREDSGGGPVAPVSPVSPPLSPSIVADAGWGVVSARVSPIDIPPLTLSSSLFVELEVDLLTGRTHQIRGQLAAIGLPIIGDKMYGGAGAARRPHEDGGGGGGGEENKQETTIELGGGSCTNVLHLQCCEITFRVPSLRPEPPAGEELLYELPARERRRRKRGEGTFDKAEESVTHRLETAFWRSEDDGNTAIATTDIATIE